MEPFSATDVRLGDVLVLRKSHPCGESRWLVVRLGADIGLRCLGCRRRVLLPRGELARRVRSVAERGPEAADDPRRHLPVP